MKLSTKVAAVSLLPILGVAGFAAEQMRGAWTRLLEANRVAEIVFIAPWVGSLVHELQKERGSSSTFAASKGATFADIVPKQRVTTDQALATYTRNVSALAATREGPLAAVLAAAGQSLNGIPSLRENVDKYAISGPEVARAYTAVISQLIAVLNLLPTLTDEGTIAGAGIAYTAIVSAEEFAGLERATGSRGFSAGEAGKGFAVVAAEVKTLATQTAKATDDISRQIAEIQSSSLQAVQAIRNIAGRMDEIASLTTSIAAGVEEQDAATGQISKNVDYSEVNRNVQGVADAIARTNEEARRVNQTSSDLVESTGKLSSSVETFLKAISAEVSDRRQDKRQTCDIPVSVEFDGRSHDTRMLDVGPTGIRVRNVAGLLPNTLCRVQLPKIEPITARAIWINTEFTGLAIDGRKLDPAELAQFTDKAALAA